MVSLGCMVVEVTTRHYILGANRAAIDKAVDRFSPRNYADVAPNVKALLLMPNDKVVAMTFPEDMVRVFTKDPKPADRMMYQIARYVSWLVFAGHLIALSLAQLSVQIISLILLLLGTTSTFWKIGCDDSPIDPLKLKNPGGNAADTQVVFSCRIGTLLTATVTEWALQEVGWRPLEEPHRHARRQDVYAWLDLKANEEEYMKRWNLFPLGENSGWYERYKEKKEQRQAWIAGKS
jgi:hypothetical protein